MLFPIFRVEDWDISGKDEGKLIAFDYFIVSLLNL